MRERSKANFPVPHFINSYVRLICATFPNYRLCEVVVPNAQDRSFVPDFKRHTRRAVEVGVLSAPC